MAYQADLLTRIRNLRWATGKFTFVSGASPKVRDYWGVSAFSAKGTEWININNHILVPKSSNPSTALTCSVRGKLGKQDAIMAGGIAAYATKDSLGNPITRFVPIAVISTNDGASWTDISLPFVPPDSFDRPENCPSAPVLGVGYNKQQQSFYAVWWKPVPEGPFIGVDVVTTQYPGWGEIGGYPSKTVVCDLRGGLGGSGLVFGSSQRQDQVINAGGHQIAVSDALDGILIDGVLRPVSGVPEVYCVAAGQGVIVVGGFHDDNSVQARSLNNGASWAPISELTDIYGAGQGGGFTPMFTCS